jgi:hypothetical protein
MDRGHLNLLRRRYGVRPNVALFLEAVAPDGPAGARGPRSLPGDAAAFERVLDLIEAGCSAAVARWRDSSAPSEVRGT